MKRETHIPSLEKLLHSKWSAVRVRDREKHFVVTRVVKARSVPDAGPRVELEAITSKRRFEIPADELADSDSWTRGWT